MASIGFTYIQLQQRTVNRFAKVVVASTLLQCMRVLVASHPF